jgi:hypothetical protein
MKTTNRCYFLPPYDVEENGELFFVKSLDPTMWMWGIGATREEAIRDFTKAFVSDYESLEADDNLTQDAIDLRERLRKHFGTLEVIQGISSISLTARFP